VTCDPGTPGQCEYRYTVVSVVQQQALRRGQPHGQWAPARRRAVFLQSFEVHDTVNQKIQPDRIDQTTLEIALWRPNAPKKERTQVTIVLAPSVRGGTKVTLNEHLELCVPTGPIPRCP